MADSKFYEESAGSQRSEKEAKIYTVIHVVGIVFFVIGGFLVMLSFLTVPSMIESTKDNGAVLAFSLTIWLVFVAMFLLFGFLCMRFKRRYNVSFDYVFVEDELRITKVFNGKKRKFLYLLKADQILKIGYCESDSFSDTLAGMQGRKPKYVTPNAEPSEGKEFIYILHSDTMGKDLFVLECRKLMLEHLVRAVGVNKFVRK